MTNVHFARVSGNAKTGPIPVTTSPRDTCPTTCSFKGNGCYAENFPMALHWTKVSLGERGMPWADFVDEISRLPKHQLWRHNQAGDLAGSGVLIDKPKLLELAHANRGRRGFTYTHYPMVGDNLRAVRAAIKAGFTVNVSADSLGQAELLWKKKLPVVAVVPRGWKGKQTPGGMPVTLCPAQFTDLTCATCALCQKADRRAIVAFEAHGGRRKVVERIINIEELK
jgi:hypothetical protein